ncbi:transposase [Paracoccus lutimaris]|uniref:Transposase n=1 Tax=Paracoccus lutimaris TaxID=1490030 RepID=A0A368YMS7_9RHOB|nr:transposase [Paracoccus lutimaris]RCW80227.1 transposase [Paracoccus lutimaris]
MPAPLSQDLRHRFRRYIEDGLSAREAARRLLISPATGVRLARRVRQGEALVAQKCGRPLGWGKLGPHKALLVELVEQDPDITMAELKGALAGVEGVHVHESSLSRALRRMGYRFKKNHRWRMSADQPHFGGPV